MMPPCAGNVKRDYQKEWRRFLAPRASYSVAAVNGVCYGSPVSLGCGSSDRRKTVILKQIFKPCVALLLAVACLAGCGYISK